MYAIKDKSDTDIQSDVLAELGFEPIVKATNIGVLVKDGVVTLNGSATSYSEKRNALQAAKRVAGVKAVVDDISIRQPDSQRYTDSDIASAAAQQIRWSALVHPETVGVTVREGKITLEGKVEWQYQREAAERVVEHLAGVRGVVNLVKIQSKETPVDVLIAIRSAYERSAILDARGINLEIAGDTVKLLGQVRNHVEREEAERIAWAASGVADVDNRLSIAWSWSLTE